MTDQQESLRSRFRVALAERTRNIVAVTSESSNPPTDSTRQQLLGLLHTLKGEARMLGLSLLATISHRLEEQLLSEELDFDAFAAVVDAVSLAMAEATGDRESQELLATAAEALGLKIESDASDSTDSGAEPARIAPKAERWIQVDATMVERLGESLATLSVELAQQAAALNSESAWQRRDALLGFDELKGRLQDALSIALDLRLTSIEPLLSSLSAHIRLLSKERGKSVQVLVRSGGVRVERDVLEALREPLLHLCSNAVVHGLEPTQERQGKPAQGKIVLSAETTGAGVCVRVTDDGRGINTDRAGGHTATHGAKETYDFLFEPGFSTHDGTDEVAGRGVGLDVVKRNVLAVGGSVDVESQKGKGTTFTVTVPALLTQQDVVAFEIGRTLYGVPAHHVLAIVASDQDQEKSIKFEGQNVPVRSASALVRHPGPSRERHILILRFAQAVWALAIGDLLGHFEVIRRPTSPALRERTGVGASAQLDNGRLLLILSPQFIEEGFAAPQLSPASGFSEQPMPRKARQRVLVVDDSVVVRDLICEILVSAGYETDTAEDGVRALEAIERFEPGLIVSDVEMPQMDGFELLAAIRQKSHTLPVIMVTARSSAKDRQRASTLGASAYVSKGEFQRDSLLATIDRYYPKVS